MSRSRARSKTSSSKVRSPIGASLIAAVTSTSCSSSRRCTAARAARARSPPPPRWPARAGRRPRPVDVGEDLLAAGVVAGVVEALSLEEGPAAEIVLGGAQPDGRPTGLLRPGGRARRPGRCRDRGVGGRGGRSRCPRPGAGCRGAGRSTSSTATGSPVGREVEVAGLGVEVPAELQPAGRQLGESGYLGRVVHPLGGVEQVDRGGHRGSVARVDANQAHGRRRRSGTV